MTTAEKYINEEYNEVKDDFGSIEQFMEHDQLLLYPLEHGFIFNDGSTLDISGNRDHRMIDIDDWGSKGIITYHIDDIVNIRINNYDMYNSYQEDILKDIINNEDKEIIFDVYDGIYSGSNLLKHGKAIDWYDFAKQVNSIDINEGIMSFKEFLKL